MPVYERSTRVRAPFEEVWEFYSKPSGFAAVTPEFLNLRIESVTGPDGTPEPEVLEEGTRVRSSIRPFGVGPRTAWVSTITERSEGADAATFSDEMSDGPFARWHHTHRFRADGDATFLLDRVEYRLRDGPAGAALDPFGRLGLEPMFYLRHRRTRELLEG